VNKTVPESSADHRRGGFGQSAGFDVAVGG
jgi:hypothetical protein